MSKCGIYAIRNIVNGDLYVGQSSNIDYRFRTHARELKTNKHYNTHLQRSYNKYGLECFELIVLEECSKTDLTLNEQKWINYFPKEKLFNQIFDVQFRQGESNPFYGKKHSEDAKNRMSKAKKGKFAGKNNPNFGVKQPLSVRLKMTERNGSTKLTKTQVLEIFELLKQDNMSHAEIAAIYNISRTVVTRIANGTRWSNITGGCVRPVVRIDGCREFSESHKARIGEGRRGKQHSEESKEKIRAGRIGKKPSNETRLKLSEAQKNRRQSVNRENYDLRF